MQVQYIFPKNIMMVQSITNNSFDTAKIIAKLRRRTIYLGTKTMKPFALIFTILASASVGLIGKKKKKTISMTFCAAKYKSKQGILEII